MLKQVYVEKDTSKLSESGIDFFILNGFKKGERTAITHIHNTIEFIYIINGNFLFYLNDEKLTATRGDLILIRSNTIHTIFANDSGGAYSVLKIKQSVIFDMASEGRGALYLLPLSLHQKGQKSIFTDEEIKLCGIYPIISEMLSLLGNEEYASDLILKADTVRLLALILEYFKKNYPNEDKDISLYAMQQIYDAMLYINKNFDQNISARDCAINVDMSYTYFSRQFKKIAGKSFTEYLTETRINHAKKALLMTNKSVTEICFQCGFNDVSYFISKFKKAHNMSPYHFRKSHNASI